MFDIADKEKLIQEIQDEIGYPSIYVELSSLNQWSTIDQLFQEVSNAVCMSTKAHTDKMVETIIKRLYTRKEFEQDIGLRD